MGDRRRLEFWVHPPHKWPLIAILAVLATGPAHAQTEVKRADEHSDSMDDTSRFIFYSVLEGLYEDGLSNEDVQQILLKKDKQAYFHFIYSCPVCTPAIWALETYRSRPQRFYSLKQSGSTFGQGLSAELHDQLYSDNETKRLMAINALVKEWIGRRMKLLNLPPKEREALLGKLEEKRKEGMRALESFRRLEHGPTFGIPEAAPAYLHLTECAVCNRAVGKLMPLPAAKPK